MTLPTIPKLSPSPTLAQLTAPSATPTATPATYKHPPSQADQLPFPNILIVGESGSGKSYSLRNLPPEDTIFINVERKGFPFKSDAPYQYFPKSAHELETLVTRLEKAPEFFIVIDSLTKYLELLEIECTKAYKNYEIWANYKRRVADFLESLKSHRHCFIVIAIPEIVQATAENGLTSSVRRVKVQGKAWEGSIEKEFTCAFFTSVKKDPKDASQINYTFITNTDGICSAKSPAGLFEQRIPNCIASVTSKLREYYATGSK